jgi:hypothetical protein
MANVYAGYRGLIDIAGVGQVRFSDASIAARQTVNIPDLITGDWDRDAYNYGPIEVGGSVSGPVTETFISGSGGGSGLWAWGVKRTGDCGLMTADTVKLYYYCGGSEMNTRSFGGMLVNTLGFSCAAGDVAQFTMDLMGNSAGTWTNEIPPHFTTAEKLLTWDKVTLAITPSAGNPGGADFTPPANIAYSNFDFSIANNLTAVYSLGQANLFPFEIVPGMRTITGSISVYNTPQANGYDTWDDYIAAGVSTISFNIGGIVISILCRFHRVEPASSVTPIISTIGWTGVTSQAALDA